MLGYRVFLIIKCLILGAHCSVIVLYLQRTNLMASVLVVSLYSVLINLFNY